jgi:hypothetical protein
VIINAIALRNGAEKSSQNYTKSHKTATFWKENTIKNVNNQ